MKQTPPKLQKQLQSAMELHRQGASEQAEAIYRAVLEVMPDEPNAWHLLGALDWQRGNLELAESKIRKAIALHPIVASYHSNLGGVLRQKGDVEGATAEYEQALKLAPKDDKAKKDLIQILHQAAKYAADKREWDKAQELYNRVLAFDPANVPTLNNLAALVQHRGNRAGANILYERALKVAPDNLPLRYNRAINLLTQGYLEQGWVDFRMSEPYWRDKQDNRPDLPWLTLPLWNGTDNLTGKKILVWGDQGIGDEIVYSSMVPDLLDRGAKVTIEIRDRLVPIYQRSFPDASIMPRETVPIPGKDFDYHAPGMWLPSCFRPTLDSFPDRKSFLKPDPVLTEKFCKRYQAFGMKKIIGISWYTQSYSWGRERSIELPELLAPLPLDDLLIIDLQYGTTQEAWEKAKEVFPNLIYLRDNEVDQFNDMESFTAQVAACDGVLTICNTTSHVAGAIGVPGIVLMPNEGLTWYWFEEGEQCPWYSSLRLIRPNVPDRYQMAAEMIKAI